MPRAARHVVVAMQIAVRQDVDAGALLITQHRGHGVLELLAEAHLHHASVERATPHAIVVPARARPGAGYRTGEDVIGGECVHGQTATPDASRQPSSNGTVAQAGPPSRPVPAIRASST